MKNNLFFLVWLQLTRCNVIKRSLRDARGPPPAMLDYCLLIFYVVQKTLCYLKNVFYFKYLSCLPISHFVSSRQKMNHLTNLFCLLLRDKPLPKQTPTVFTAQPHVVRLTIHIWFGGNTSCVELFSHSISVSLDLLKCKQPSGLAVIPSFLCFYSEFFP